MDQEEAGNEGLSFRTSKGFLGSKKKKEREKTGERMRVTCSFVCLVRDNQGIDGKINA